MFARSALAALLVTATACAAATSTPAAIPTTTAAPSPAPPAEAPKYCAYERPPEGLLPWLRMTAMLHRSCLYGHEVELLRSGVSAACRAPLRDLRDSLREEEALDEVHDCLVPSARDTFATRLAETVQALTPPACRWKPTEPAAANPRAAECPLPADLLLEIATPDERARKAKGEAVVPERYKTIPAGVLAFVATWASVDDELTARLHQRALLTCDWSAKVEYQDGTCLVNGTPEVRP